MAGDWIKMRCDLDEDPSTIGIAERTGLDIDTTIGKLFRFWRWINRQSRDGHAPVSLVYVDRHVACAGFAQAMVDVGWLEPAGERGFRVPRFDRHNSKSAKQRALATVRKQDQRSRSGHGGRGTSAGPEKRREEKRRVRKNTPLTPLTGGFERFWSAYPRKVARQSALKAWNKLDPDAVLAETILAAIATHSRSEQWTKDGGAFIPHPTTWLNQRRWEDEVAPGRDLYSGLRDFLQGGPM